MSDRPSDHTFDSWQARALAVKTAAHMCGITGRSVAKDLGVDEAYISRVLNGKQTGPRVLAATKTLILEKTQQTQVAQRQKAGPPADLAATVSPGGVRVTPELSPTV